MTARQDLVLWGASGQARVLNELVSDSPWRICALVDNRPLTSPIAGIPVLVGVEGLDIWLKTRAADRPLFGAVAVGGSRGADRLQLLETLASRGIEIVTLVHRTAFTANAGICEHLAAVSNVAVVCNEGRSVDQSYDLYAARCQGLE